MSILARLFQLRVQIAYMTVLVRTGKEMMRHSKLTHCLTTGSSPQVLSDVCFTQENEGNGEGESKSEQKNLWPDRSISIRTLTFG